MRGPASWWSRHRASLSIVALVLAPAALLGGGAYLLGSLSPDFRTVRAKLTLRSEVDYSLRCCPERRTLVRVRLPDSDVEDIDDPALASSVGRARQRTGLVEFNTRTDSVQRVTFQGVRFDENGSVAGIVGGALGIAAGLFLLGWGVRTRRRSRRAHGDQPLPA